MAFEDILKQISEETDRTQLAEMARKYPSLREFAELGERVQGLRPRLKALSVANADFEADPSLAVKELEDWRKWRVEEYPKDQARATSLQEALAATQARVQEYEARTESDMTPDEIRQLFREEIKTLGVVTATDVDTKLNEFTTTKFQPALNSNMEGMATRFEDIFDKVENVIQEHQVSLGERIRPKAVFDKMREMATARGTVAAKIDPEEAYREIAAPRLAEKSKAQFEADKIKAREEGILEGRKQALSVTPDQRGMPVNGRPGVAPGPLMQRFREKQAALEASGKGAAGGSQLGKGLIAGVAAREYAEKQLSGNSAA